MASVPAPLRWPSASPANSSPPNIAMTGPVAESSPAAAGAAAPARATHATTAIDLLTCGVPWSFDQYIVLHRRDTLHRAGDRACGVDVGAGIHEAAQLHHGLVGLDVDLRDLERRLIEDRRLHLRRDRAVVDVFAGAFLRGGGGAAEGEQHRGCDGECEKAFCWIHVEVPDNCCGRQNGCREQAG